MITFVIFHANISSESPQQERYHSYLLARQSYNFEQLCDITFRSAALFHPGCRKVLLTDIASQLQLDPSVEIIRRDINLKNMMFERMYSQLEFLRSYDFQDHLFFLDSDMIVNGSWDDVLQEEFDIGLTYDIYKAKKSNAPINSSPLTQPLQDGKYGYMPINGGVIIVKKGSAKNSLSFFEDMFRNYSNDNQSENTEWWGDQHALINTIGMDNFINRTSDTIQAGSATVRLLPTRMYNFSPPKKAHHSFRTHKAKILHFRGERKSLMPIYWKAYLEYKEKKSFFLFLKNKLELYLLWIESIYKTYQYRYLNRS